MSNDTRPIDANELIRTHGSDITNWDNPCAVYISSIENAPTLDVVEVVRCKNCKHYLEHPSLKINRKCCFVHILEPHPMRPDDFCSLGEREVADEQNV